MKIILNPDDEVLQLAFTTPEEAGAFFAEAQQQQGFFLHLGHKLKQFTRLRIEASAPPAFAFSCQAEVVQLFPGPGTFGTAFQLRGWDGEQDEALSRALAGQDAAPAGEGEADPDDAADSGREPSEFDRSPIFRIKAMKQNDRFRLATKASRTERQILLRDTAPQVLLGLLAHPRLEDKEVLEIVKSSHASSGVMQRIADSRKWMMNPEIRFAVVRSPKTPPQKAIKHLDSLRTRELRVMAKIGSAREVVRRAALRIYLKRTGNHP